MLKSNFQFGDHSGNDFKLLKLMNVVNPGNQKFFVAVITVMEAKAPRALVAAVGQLHC